MPFGLLLGIQEIFERRFQKGQNFPGGRFFGV